MPKFIHFFLFLNSPHNASTCHQAACFTDHHNERANERTNETLAIHSPINYQNRILKPKYSENNNAKTPPETPQTITGLLSPPKNPPANPLAANNLLHLQLRPNPLHCARCWPRILSGSDILMAQRSR